MKTKNNIIPCEQKRCGFLLNGGCRACKECGTKPNFVKEDCLKCFNCENKEGSLRWGDDEIKDEEKVLIKVVAK